MARNHGSLIKWLLYCAVFFMLFFLESCVLNRLPFHGVIPRLAPLAVISVACFEGALSGSIMGLAVGTLCGVVYFRGGALMVPMFTLLGMLAGSTTNKQIARTVFGGMICCAVGMLLLETVQVWLWHTFLLEDLHTLLRIAVPEGLYSLLFALPTYLLYLLVYRKFRTDSEL